MLAWSLLFCLDWTLTHDFFLLPPDCWNYQCASPCLALSCLCRLFHNITFLSWHLDTLLVVPSFILGRMRLPLRQDHLLCCFSSLSFDVTLPATCPEAEPVLQDFLELAANCEFGKFLLKGCSDNFTSLHQETWHDWGWVSLFISADFLLNI